MSYLIDTNVISELRKGPKANAGVRRWLERVDERELYLSVLVVGELRRGIELLRRRDGVAARQLDKWLQALQANFSKRILEVDAAVAEVWGELNVPNPISTIDGLMAATALTSDLTLVTRNVKDVRSTGVKVLNPFEG